MPSSIPAWLTHPVSFNAVLADGSRYWVPANHMELLNQVLTSQFWTRHSHGHCRCVESEPAIGKYLLCLSPTSHIFKIYILSTYRRLSNYINQSSRITFTYIINTEDKSLDTYISLKHKQNKKSPLLAQSFLSPKRASTGPSAVA